MLLRSSDAAKDAFVWPTAAALEKLTAHVWPGNARELGNVLQRAVVLRDGDRIEPADLHITGAPQLRIVEQVLAPADPIRLHPIRLPAVAHHSKLAAFRAALRETVRHTAAPPHTSS